MPDKGYNIIHQPPIESILFADGAELTGTEVPLAIEALKSIDNGMTVNDARRPGLCLQIGEFLINGGIDPERAAVLAHDLLMRRNLRMICSSLGKKGFRP